MTIKVAPDGHHYTEHAPGASLDYFFTWTNWLAEGEGIASSVWTCDSPDITLSDDTVEPGNKAVVFVSGGVRGRKYTLINTITTDSTPARVESLTLKLICDYR